MKFCAVPPCTHTDDKIVFDGDKCRICTRLINGDIKEPSRYDPYVVEYIEKNYCYRVDFSSIVGCIQKVFDRLDINTIPPLTNEYAKYQEKNQPKVEDIIVYDSIAKISLKDWKSLSDYSCSIPSGVYVGKMWKRCNEQFHKKMPEDKTKWNWSLCWYAYDREGDPNVVSINYRDIVITDRDDYIMVGGKYARIHKGNYARIHKGNNESLTKIPEGKYKVDLM